MMSPGNELTPHELLLEIQQQRVMAIVRGRDRDASIATCLTLVESGINLLEVSLTTKDAFDVIAAVMDRVGAETRLGAGTVVEVEDIRRVRDAGAQFIVTPGDTPAWREISASGSMPTLIGALTPSETLRAHLNGATAVKIFPASVVGPKFVRALRDPFPQIPLLAVGGVDLGTARQFLAAGAIGVGVGSPLCGDAPDGGNTGELRQRAADFVGLAQEFAVRDVG